MRKRILTSVILSCLLYCGFAWSQDKLDQDFRSPPEATKPRCFWYWFSGNYSKEGITKDLEAMRRAGVGEMELATISEGKVKCLSEEWWQFVEYAIREGSRIGVDIGLFACPGSWNMANGPWIKPNQAMRYMSLDEVRVQGPGKMELPFPKPKKDATPITFLAFPAPAADEDDISKHAPKITGDSQAGTITYELTEPFTARSLTFIPETRIDVTCELEASMDGRAFQTVCKFPIRRGPAIGGHWLGFILKAPLTEGFAPVQARYFRLKFSQPCDLGAITISAAARVHRYMEKQLATMCTKSQAAFDFYTWPAKPEPDRPELTVSRNAVVTIQPDRGADGKLTWAAPAGQWIVQRIMSVPTGMGGLKGLEADRMNPQAVGAVFDGFIGRLLADIPAAERKSLKRIFFDSWETGAQNWTDDLFTDFQSRYGYDPKPFLPVLSGRMVGGADQSDRFLWDLRRMVADRIPHDFIGAMREKANPHGIKLMIQNEGAGGMPTEFLSMAREADDVEGEFWNVGTPSFLKKPLPQPPFGSNTRGTSSAAHIYGKKQALAEAYTCGGPFRNTPATLKRQGDQIFSQGINQFQLHVAIHQPDDRRPGVYAFGTEFGQHATWFGHAKPWTDYLRRCSVMLQAGNPVADLAYFISEDAPKALGPTEAELPMGYDYDYINADVIMNRLTVKDGRFVLPDGTSYKLLMLPPSQTMRPKLLQKIKDLVTSGGSVLCAKVPERSPSLQDYPACDQTVRLIAQELWNDGKIITNTNLTQVLSQLKTPPDVMVPPELVWKHRRDGDREIYFLANQVFKPLMAKVSFRVKDQGAELWNPITGESRPLPQLTASADGRTEIELEFAPNESYFVVFGKQLAVGSGQLAAKNFPDYKPLQEITGPWEVQFDPQWFYPDTGTNGKVTFQKLEDWTTRPEHPIKYYSGTAVYRKSFEFQSKIRDPKSKIFLDLGQVNHLARVKLNGQEMGSTWTEPHRLALGSALKNGTNTLEIEVVNPWINRLLGDDTLPESQRRTYLTIKNYTGTQLSPSGLLGPVRVMAVDD